MEQIVSGDFGSHEGAEAAVRALGEAGIALRSVSIVTQNLQTTEQVQGFVTAGDVAISAGTGAWWGGVFGLLVGSAFLWIPGFGPLVVAGALASGFLGMLEGAAVGAAGGGFVGALLGYGFPRDKALKYESLVLAGHYLVLTHCEQEQAMTAREVLIKQGAQDVEVSIKLGTVPNPA